MALGVLTETQAQDSHTNEHLVLKILFENVSYVQEFEKRLRPKEQKNLRLILLYYN